MDARTPANPATPDTITARYNASVVPLCTVVRRQTVQLAANRIRDTRDWRLAPAEEGHHILRDDADGTVVADSYVLDARPFGGRDR